MSSNTYHLNCHARCTQRATTFITRICGIRVAIQERCRRTCLRIVILKNCQCYAQLAALGSIDGTASLSGILTPPAAYHLNYNLVIICGFPAFAPCAVSAASRSCAQHVKLVAVRPQFKHTRYVDGFLRDKTADHRTKVVLLSGYFDKWMTFRMTNRISRVGLYHYIKTWSFSM